MWTLDDRLPVLTFLQEVESHDEFYRSVVVGKAKLPLPVGISVDVDYQSREVLSVVPEQTGAENHVSAYIAQDILVLVALGDVRLAVAY